MPYKIRNLVIKAVALVDAGANPHSRIVLTKRRTPAIAPRRVVLTEVQPEEAMMKFSNDAVAIYKDLERGGVVLADRVAKLHRGRAEAIWQQSPGLSRNDAAVKAWGEGVDPFAAVGPDNPSLTDLFRAAQASSTNVLLAKAMADADACYQRLQHIGERIRMADPRLSEAAAFAKGLMTPEGKAAYQAYVTAKYAARRAGRS